MEEIEELKIVAQGILFSLFYFTSPFGSLYPTLCFSDLTLVEYWMHSSVLFTVNGSLKDYFVIGIIELERLETI